MNFTIGPVTVGLGQLFILVVGIAVSFAIANYFMKQGQNKIVAIAFASPVTLIAFAIAFFEVSEMWLIEFLAKMIRTHFLDATTKFQVNVEKTDPTELLIKELHSEEKIKKIEFKTAKSLLSSDEDEEVKESGLL